MRNCHNLKKWKKTKEEKKKISIRGNVFINLFFKKKKKAKQKGSDKLGQNLLQNQK